MSGKYEDLVLGKLDEIMAGSSGNIYSTEERVVGKWIDDKPIYKKTITFNTDQLTTTITRMSYNHGIANIKFVIGCVGHWASVEGQNSGGIPLGTGGTSTSIMVGLDLAGDPTYIRYTAAWGSTQPYATMTVTLYYTKTTD
jgi:hypothetical protein